jgi:hypothetical protein
MIKFMIGASAAALTVAGVATLAQARPEQPAPAPIHADMVRMSPVRGGPLHYCRAGYSWQYGCLSYAPAQPGQLFGACTVNGYGCFRDAGPIQ